MALTLIPPGTRKRQKSYVAKGWVNGQPIERSLGTADPEEAETRFLELQVSLRRGTIMPGPKFTFGEAIELYEQKRSLTTQARAWLAVLKGCELARRPAAAINSHYLLEIAPKLYPKAKPETLNRQVLTPAASVLHHAHYAGKIPWIRVRKFPEAKTPPRAVRPEVERMLLNSTTGMQHLLLLVLFRHGWRIGEALTLRWQDIDLTRMTVVVHRHKTNEWQVLPLNDEVAEKLRELPRDKKIGRVFPWSDRHNVYRWLRPLCKKLHVRFTPHMARHTFATEAITDGVPMAHVMAAGGWNDTKAFQRYGRVKWEAMDAAINRGADAGQTRGPADKKAPKR